MRDEVTLKGVPVELTDDYYAQDAKGTVWYLGEATTEYENGKPVSTEGSFEAGVDGARGRDHHARPAEGRHALPPGALQGPRRGPGEDRLAARAREGPAPPLPQDADDARDNPLEPDVLEAKFYARGVGVVLAVGMSGDTDREELIGYGTRPNHARLSPPPSSSSTSPPPAKATVTSRFSCFEDSRVPRLA